MFLTGVVLSLILAFLSRADPERRRVRLPAYCIVPARCSTKSNSTEMKTPSSIFKYSSSPKITWWFDHHESAFLSPADAAHFEQDDSNRKFYDPAFKSCTSFIAMIAEQRFGFDPRSVEPELGEMDRHFDGAMYETEVAVEDERAGHEADHAIEASTDRDFVKSSFHCWPTIRWEKSWSGLLSQPFCLRFWNGTSAP